MFHVSLLSPRPVLRHWSAQTWGSLPISFSLEGQCQSDNILVVSYPGTLLPPFQCLSHFSPVTLSLLFLEPRRHPITLYLCFSIFLEFSSPRFLLFSTTYPFTVSVRTTLNTPYKNATPSFSTPNLLACFIFSGITCHHLTYSIFYDLFLSVSPSKM